MLNSGHWPPYLGCYNDIAPTHIDPRDIFLGNGDGTFNQVPVNSGWGTAR
jgi:hypothetical protein